MHRRTATDDALAKLRAELDEGLSKDTRMLLHPAFLGALHSELRERLGPDCARGVLVRAGFYHGVRDALRALRAKASAATGPLVAMHIDPGPDRGSVAASGYWPDGLEARALLERAPAIADSGCVLSAGYTSGWLSGLWDADVVAIERACRLRGAERCRFEVRDAEVWRESADAGAGPLLAALPFDALWSLASSHVEAEAGTERMRGLDASTPAVHVWGPVMIVPYAGAETAIAVETIAREPSAAAVAVVVIDLAGAVVDEGFGALELERALEAVAALGAEAILTGVSPLSEPVVADLAGAHLVLRKDLPEAVAIAFQVAWARRRPV